MPSVKDLTLTYDGIKTFSEGDTVTGTVTLNLEKDTKVESFFVKAKGDANVHWSEKRGEHNHSYSAHKRYFKLKQFLVPENSKDTELSKGIHTFKFSFKIPAGSMPSTFKGGYGKIVYMLEAKLARSWKLDRCVKQEINFASKALLNSSHLMTRQVGSTDKAVGVFSRGAVHMEAAIESGVYTPGETATISVKVNNTSSKDMTPKFSLKQKVMYHAQGRSKHGEHVVCKLVGDVIEKNTERTITCAFKIPYNETSSISNCEIISVEHQLKVYLDISFSSDPEIKFPLVIVGDKRRLGPGGAAPPYAPAVYGGPSSSDFPPPAAGFGYPPLPGPAGHPGGAFGSGYGAVPEQQPPPAYPLYPAVPAAFPSAFPAHAGAAYSDPPPRSISPYGPPGHFSGSRVNHPPPPPPPAAPFPPAAAAPFPPPPTAPFPPPSAPMFNPAPSAPPSFDYGSDLPTYNLPSFMSGADTDFLSQQNEEPPSYLSIFPPPTTDKPAK